MKKTKGFFVSCLFLCIFFGFPITGISGSGPGPGGSGPGGTDPSKYVIGDIHSNQDVSGSDQGSNKNYYIEGNISAVGTVSLSDVNATSTQSGASPIHIPGMDFAAFQNADGQAIDAPPAWGAGATNQIMYTDGDVSIDLADCATYHYKTVVAAGNITVTRTPGGHQDSELMANLIARGSIDINLHGCGSSSYGITGFIFSLGEEAIYLGHDGKGDFTGVNIDLNGGGHAPKSIAGVVMAKNSGIAIDLHGCGSGDKGIEYADVLINDFIKLTTCWREI
jgi:hypothetical protein